MSYRAAAATICFLLVLLAYTAEGQHTRVNPGSSFMEKDHSDWSRRGNDGEDGSSFQRNNPAQRPLVK